MLQRSSGNRFPDTEDGRGHGPRLRARKTSIFTCFEH